MKKIENKEELRELILNWNDKGLSQKEMTELIKDYDYSSITDMNYMFAGCHNLTFIPYFITSNVINMEGIFLDCRNLTTIPELDTSNANNMSGMFYRCKNLTTIPYLDTSKAEDIKNMFDKCKSLIKTKDKKTIIQMILILERQGNNKFKRLTLNKEDMKELRKRLNNLMEENKYKTV